MKRILLFYFILFFSHVVSGQIISEYEDTDTMRLYRYSGHIYNGEVFTPTGDFRVLIVFITFGGIYDTMYLEGWNNGDFPDWAMSSNEDAFYHDYTDFPNDIYSDTNRKSVSNFYYQMSRGQFRLVADYYPEVITLSPIPNERRDEFHKRVVQQIPRSFDWTPYDKRKNCPRFLTDNSNSLPDNIVDYIVFCYRFSHDWDTWPASWIRGYDGEASIGISNAYPTTPGSNMNIKDGFTFLSGARDPISIFPHEMGHKIYCAPHYAGANHVAGNYFYEPIAGWGMIHLDNSYTCAAGWERYILNWVPDIKANEVDAKIENVSDLFANNGLFLLRDFIATGDAIRIRVPAGDGNYQYLWLENHQGKSTFDGNILIDNYCGLPIDEYKSGLVAYVEAFSHAKDTNVFNLYKIGNGIRWISKKGDYDFGFSPNGFSPSPIVCRNLFTYPFYRLVENPIGGQSVGERIRHDFNNDGRIGYNENTSFGDIYNQADNEGKEVFSLNIPYISAKYFTGSGMQFQVGDKIGIARNPCVRNIPKYDSTAYLMGDYYLNGISVEVLSQNVDSSMVVKVRLDDVAIDRNVRWSAASIVLTDITGDSRPDVDVRPTVTVNIDKSGTPNRHKNPANPNQTSSTVKDFITPTTFTCRSGSYFKQDTFSIVNVRDSSTLVLESGSIYEICDHAVLNIDSSGTLVVKSGATLRVKGTGHVEINNGAYICIEDGAIIELVNALSSVNLRQGYNLGVNPDASTQSGSCTSTPLTNFAIATGCAGSIHKFTVNRYIQRTTYYGDTYVAGKNIWAGSHVLPQALHGAVIFENGSHVILDGNADVHLEYGVNVKLGATLEIR